MANSNSASSAENPQSPETIDSSCVHKIDYTSMALLSSDSDEQNCEVILPIDPDRPPTSKKDLKKIQN